MGFAVDRSNGVAVLLLVCLGATVHPEAMARASLANVNQRARSRQATKGVETASQLFRRVSPSVVVVLTYDAAGKATELGSGVKLPDGSVATNCHVLKGGSSYRVRYLGKQYPANLDKADWNRDVCTLAVPDLPAPPVVLGNTRTLQVGATVYAIGTPEGLQRTLSEGIVSSLRPVSGGSYIQTTAAISPGSSGGGLFDDHGRLLGLTSFFITKGQQLNFALPVEWIEALPRQKVVDLAAYGTPVNSPQHTTARIASGRSEVQWLNRAAALESAKGWKGLQALSERWIRAEPQNEVAWFSLGEADTYLGQYAQAIEADRSALQIDPRNDSTWNNLGNAYDDAGQYAQAIEAERQALKINPRDADAWNNLGTAYDHAGQHAQAIEAERQALKINPQDADAWGNLGVAYGEAFQYERAIDAERHVLQINPQDADAWTDLGLAYDYAGQYAQAIEAERQALKINPQDAHAWNNLGLAYAAAGQHAQAIEAYRHALQINPQYAEAWTDLGFAYDGAGQHAQAMEADRQALQINPRNADLWFNLGVHCDDAGKPAQAIDAYRHMLQIDPRDGMAWFDLGADYAQLGANSKALTVYQNLKALDPAAAQDLFELIVRSSPSQPITGPLTFSRSNTPLSTGNNPPAFSQPQPLRRLAGVTPQGLPAPSQAVLKSAYCYGVISEQEAAENADEEYLFRGASTETRNTVDALQQKENHEENTQLERLKRYIFPTLPYVDNGMLLAAMQQGKIDVENIASETKPCFQRCEHSSGSAIAQSQCYARCDEMSEAYRHTKICQSLAFLPY